MAFVKGVVNFFIFPVIFIVLIFMLLPVFLLTEDVNIFQWGLNHMFEQK